jgi:hypothetical protein
MSIQEKLHQFKSKIENDTYYSDEKTKQKNIKLAHEVESYIMGDSAKVPIIIIKDYSEYIFVDINELLSGEAVPNHYDYKVLDIIAESWKNAKSTNYDNLGRSLSDTLRELLYQEKNIKDDFTKEIISYITDKKGVQIDKFISLLVEHYFSFYNYGEKNEKDYPNSIARYILSHFPEKATTIIKAAGSSGGYYAEDLIELLAKEKPKECIPYLNDILSIIGLHNQSIIEMLLKTDSKSVLPVVQKEFLAIKPVDIDHNYFGIAKVLIEYDKNIINKIKKNCIDHITHHKQQGQNSSSRYFYDGYTGSAMQWLIENYPDDFLPILKDYIENIPYFRHPNIFYDCIKQYGHETVLPIILLSLNAKVPKWEAQYLLAAFKENYDIEKYAEPYWQIFEAKNKTIRNMIIPVLAKLGDKITEKTASYLSHKNADIRESATLLLSMIGTKSALEHIKTALQKETNEDTRDAMLKVVASKSRKKKYTESEIQEIIQNTENRKKLEKPVREWLQEKDLPDLYWQNGKKLTEKEVRFILYRQSREKTMRPDPELKPILTLIEKSKSGKFAKEVLSRFTKGKMDSKDKFCLSIAGLLGDDSVVDSIKAAIMEWTAGSRGKMAEYAVQALANVGSPKALRVVEFCSRKFANKQKNVGAAAKEAFNDAAEALDITMYELEDMIVPDFDFGGTHKTFMVKDKEYRAFVDNNFTFVFIDEDNKRYKSLPKAAPKELQDEFKVINKEFKEVMKLQHQRMQNYMVAQRRWTVKRWQELFMNNPVLYPYSTSLIWALYDKNQKLITPFFFDYESFRNSQQKEVELTSDGYIGIVHPMELNDAEREAWKNILEEYAIQPPFNQMFREVIALENKDKDKKMYKGLADKKIDMYAFRSAVEKNGWARGSVQDGGTVASYYKPMLSVDIDVFMNIYGFSVDGYDYDDGVTVESVYFVKHGAVSTGNYSYDEPYDEKDKRLIAFEKVPPIIYSEIMMEIKRLENLADNQEEESENE